MVTTVTVSRADLETKVRDMYREVALHPENHWSSRTSASTTSYAATLRPEIRLATGTR